MKSFSSIIVAVIVAIFSLAGTQTSQAGSFDGTFEGKARILVDGKVTSVEAVLTIEGGAVDLVLTNGTTVLDLNVTAFIDNRGVYFGVLSDSTGVLIAGFGGRINGKSKKSHVIGRFIQEDYSHPFHFKRVVESKK